MTTAEQFIKLVCWNPYYRPLNLYNLWHTHTHENTLRFRRSTNDQLIRSTRNFLFPQFFLSYKRKKGWIYILLICHIRRIFHFSFVFSPPIAFIRYVETKFNLLSDKQKEKSMWNMLSSYKKTERSNNFFPFLSCFAISTHFCTAKQNHHCWIFKARYHFVLDPRLFFCCFNFFFFLMEKSLPL